ncbi:type II toxin-antitoxin system VapC family toxin [Nodularia sphaerocarpa]|uniref:type II toxin-antitoxin system VapC family toxin n=1 Tax=Nodularia sphaerocarpa TaxID=137816 RepID=UPI001EFA2ADB|nr:type II toxin-antitoxin system VapC family toxin [Nodularia sphaerocarpa]MDB9372653.1 type II toxin-antitoxin system VapC family toxin [Nodularia sphaerocarpa CS-585]MDB9377041.1 type II toxin-antitoxin system VapC family toxin [Nodularia sphaerocarpa CS-585A2]ULP71159.1 tRNA(fMet)-specific endonuclease VapC [Nodularia sphaerocarpa UHCC 0038]
MSYLLDTCVISDFVKGEENTLQRIKLIPPAEIFVSSLTVMEVKYGLAINPQRAVKIQSIIATLLNSITILPFDSKEAEQAAQIRSFLKLAGSPIGAYDVLIAATAVINNHIVVTSNVREFQRVPNLQIENWRSV